MPRDRAAEGRGRTALVLALQGRDGADIEAYLRGRTIERQMDPGGDATELRVHAAECRFARGLIALKDADPNGPAEDGDEND